MRGRRNDGLETPHQQFERGGVVPEYDVVAERAFGVGAGPVLLLHDVARHVRIEPDPQHEGGQVHLAQRLGEKVLGLLAHGQQGAVVVERQVQDHLLQGDAVELEHAVPVPA